MGTWNAFYVRKTTAESKQAIVAAIPAAEIEESLSFLGVRMSDDAFRPPKTALYKLSRRLGTDVLWLSFQSLVDAFQFHHWYEGRRVRSLVFGSFEERIWETVEGSAEPWERAVFFEKRKLELEIEYARDAPARKELRRIWREAEILPGRTKPTLNSKDCARTIAAHYGLPHYGL